MRLPDWGLTADRTRSLSSAELSEYESAIAEYDAAVEAAQVPWAQVRGLQSPPSPEGIRAMTRAITEVAEECRVVV